MFTLKSKIINGQTTVGYIVTDDSNREKVLSVEQVQGLAMAGSVKDVKFNEKQQTLIGLNGNDLRKLPKKQQKVSVADERMHKVFKEQMLNNLVHLNTNYKERFLISDLMSFLKNSPQGKICALYGLRRTGKTTLMYHGIKRLLQENISNVAYMTLTESDSLAWVYGTIDRLIKSGIEYIFVDEITAVNGFMQSSALLADTYAKQGVHIVIAGTDSYVIELAGQNNLYDRLIKINTTYIGYKEYSYLNPNTGILNYIRVGGVLPADIFYDEQKTNAYVSTAISNNIINSLRRANNKKEYAHLLELDNRGLLKKAIEQAIAESNNELTTYVITDVYKNGDLGSAKQIMEAQFDISGTLDDEEIEDRIRYSLSIVKKFDAEISEDYCLELQDFLIEIGAIRKYSRYTARRKIEVPIFVQPGLRYNQTIELLKALFESASFYNIPKSIRDEFVNKILQDVEGNLIEHEILLSNLVRYTGKKGVEVTQINYKGKEIDMLIHDENIADIYEIKRSSNAVDEQCRWLADAEFNAYIETMFGCKIRERTVLYLGGDAQITYQGQEINYKNINSYLQEM